MGRRSGLLSDTDIVNGYMWLLGRVPSAGEIDANRRHYEAVGHGAVADFKRALATSEEFRQHRLRFHKLSRTWTTELDRPRLVFLHLEKCGGTSLHAMLAPCFPADRICPERHDGLGDWTVNELAAFDLFSGHFDLVCCRSIPGRLRIVTMLRQPKARLLSLYRFWKAHRPHPERDVYNLVGLARSCSLEEFFSHPTVIRHTAICNAITGQLTRSRTKMLLEEHDPIVADPAGALEQAWSALGQFAGVGLLERFEDSRLLLNDALGLDMQPVAPMQVLAQMMRTDPDLVELEFEPMTDAVDALLDPLTAIDQALYDRAAAGFESRVRERAAQSCGGSAEAAVGGRPAPRGPRSSLFGTITAKVRRSA